MTIVVSACSRSTKRDVSGSGAANAPTKWNQAEADKSPSFSHFTSHCYKPSEPEDQILRVIKWEFRVAYVGAPFPKGHYVNYFTFTYSPSDNRSPCNTDSVGGQVCDHDVVSDTKDGMPTCRYLVSDEQVTEIRIRSGSIRASGASMNDCTCP